MPMETETDYDGVEVVKKVWEEVAHVRWVINNFTEAYESAADEEEPLESDDFEIKSDSFKLKLYCPELDDDDDNFSLGLSQTFEGNDPVDIEAKAWLEDLDGNKYCEFKLDDSDNYGEVVNHDFAGSFKKQDLGTTIKLKDDVAIICCRVREHAPGEEIMLPKVDLKLLQKLWDSCQRGLFDGINIQVEGKTFVVSKNILATHSDVFERMFLTSNCKEVQENIIEIKEVRYEVMKAFIEYLNGSQVDNLSDVCEDLFVLADRYMVSQLKEECSKEMVSSLTKENLFARLHLAFLYDQQDLKNAVLRYITKPNSNLNFRQIMETVEWHKLITSNGMLANEITTAVHDKMEWFSKQRNNDGPKYPLNAYMLWCQENYPILKEEGIEGKDLIKELAARWKELLDEDKQAYKDQAAELMEEYKRLIGNE